MPTSVDDQLRQLGMAYEDFVDEITVAELLRRPGSLIETSDNGAEDDRPRSSNRLLLVAAAVLLAAGLVAVVWAAGRGGNPAVVDGPANDLAPIPPERLPADAVFAASRDSEVGRFELYEIPAADAEDVVRCLYLRTEVISYGDCYERGFIGVGNASETLLVDGERVVFGLLPPDEDGRAALRVGTVPFEEEGPIPADGERTVEPDDNGIWYIVADDEETHVAVDTWCCQTSGPIPTPTWPGTARVVDGGTALELEFAGELPLVPGDHCTADYTATARELPHGIYVEIETIRPAVDPDDQECLEIVAVSRRVRAELSGPHAGRRVFVQGRPVAVESAVAATSTLPSPLADLVQPDWALRGWVDTVVGRFDIYDVASGREVCINHTSPSGGGGSSGCHDVDDIAAGRMWGGSSEDEGAALWGLAPLDVEFRVTVAGTTVVPNELGFWFTLIEDNVSEFTIEAPCCTNVIPVGAPLNTVPGSTTDPSRPDVVIDSPLIANAFDGVRTSPDGRMLLIWFTGAPEYEPGNHCTMRYVPSVLESPTEVVLTIRGERPARVADFECSAEGHFRIVSVPLAEPLANRPVIYLGALLEIVDGARLLEPGWTPGEWTIVLEGRGHLEAPTWFREWRPGAFGRCSDGLSKLTLVEGPAPFIGDFNADGRERDLGEFDINGSPGRVLVFPPAGAQDGSLIGTGARLAWATGDREHVIEASLCGDDEERSIASLLRFALDLRQPS